MVIGLSENIVIGWAANRSATEERRLGSLALYLAWCRLGVVCQSALSVSVLFVPPPPSLLDITVPEVAL